jgi:hypothetical protein
VYCGLAEWLLSGEFARGRVFLVDADRGEVFGGVEPSEGPDLHVAGRRGDRDRAAAVAEDVGHGEYQFRCDIDS